MGQQKCEARAAAGRGGSDAGEVSRPGRGTEVVGCGSCSVGGDKARVLSPASREVSGSSGGIWGRTLRRCLCRPAHVGTWQPLLSGTGSLLAPLTGCTHVHGDPTSGAATAGFALLSQDVVWVVL